MSFNFNRLVYPNRKPWFCANPGSLAESGDSKNFGRTRIVGTNTQGLQENINMNHGHAHAHIYLIHTYVHIYIYIYIYIHAIQLYIYIFIY